MLIYIGKIMSSLSDSSRQNLLSRQTHVKGLAISSVLKLQKNLSLFPKKICLISGAPRSGTSALCEWLGHQQGVSAFPESRILVSTHRFMEEIHRFANLENNSTRIEDLTRRLIFDYYSSSRILIGKRLLLDKEPLEPIAFPIKDYGHFIINVKRLLPDVKLILTIRDPIATIWSMSQRKWGESLSNKEAKRFSIEQYIENWCSCADLTLKYYSDSNTYIVQFGRLINDPENESRRIFNFLNIRNGEPFQPRQTNKIGFSNEVLEKIFRMTQPRVDFLNSKGIADLS